MTYRELQAILRNYRDSGTTLTCKLTVKKAILEAELACIEYHLSKESAETK